MRKRISRLRIYAISFIVWLFIVGVAGVLASNKFFKESKDDVIALVNEHIPIKLDIDSIKFIFPFNIDFHKVEVSTKDSEDEFLYVEYLQLVINPIRYFVRNNVYDILDSANSKDATFYTRYFDLDNIQKYVKTTEPKNTDPLVAVNEVIHILENKSITVDDFAVRYDKSEENNLDLSLETLHAYFTDTRYILDTTFNLPDNTKLTVNLDSTKSPYISTNTNQLLNIEQASLLLKASDNSGALFNYAMDLSFTNKNLDILLHTKRDTMITADSLTTSKDEDVIKASYNIGSKKADFEIYDFVLTPKMIYKSIDMLRDVENSSMAKVLPASFSVTENEKFAEMMSYIAGFVSAKFNVKGRYAPQEPLYIDMRSSTKMEALSLDFELEITNNVLISDRFNLSLKDNANIKAKLRAPLDELYASKLVASVEDLIIGENKASFDVDFAPVFNRTNSSFSQLQIKNVRLNQFYIQDESFDILVNKRASTARVKNTNADDSIFAFDVYFKNKDNFSLAGRGILPTSFINNIAGKNIIDPLVLVYADYSVTNVTKDIRHDLSLYSERIIGLEKIFEVDTTFINKELLLNSFILNPDGNDPIKANGRLAQSTSNDDMFIISLNVDTPVGEYKPRAVISRLRDRVTVDVRTDDAVIEGSGVVGYDGSVDFKIGTKEALSIDGIDILANVSAFKEAEQENIDVNGDFDITVSKDNISFNAKSHFTADVGNKSLMLTNIVYQNLGNRFEGEGSVAMENVSANVKFALREAYGGKGAIYANMLVNAEHINAEIETKHLRISSIYHTSKFDGYLSGGTVIVGSTKNPSVVLKDIELTDFDFGAERFQIKVKGEYRNKEATIDNILITKQGRMNVYLGREETIRIYDSFWSEERQKINLDIKNYVAITSTFNAKFKYDMEKDNYGQSVYNIIGTGLRINHRKLPNLNTTAIYDGTRIRLSHRGSHGFRGNIMLISGSSVFNAWYIYDNLEMLNGYGEIRSGVANMYLVSENLGLEIFEIFNVIFKKIDTYKGDFTFAMGSKNYTLYSHITGELSSLSIDGRFVGRGKVRGQYFKDNFDDSTVDFDFNGKLFSINQLTLLTKKEARGVTMVGGADFINNSFENMTFHLTTVSDAFNVLFLIPDRADGFLDANADFGIFQTRGLVKLDLKFQQGMKDPVIAGDVYIEKNELQFTISPTTRRYTSDIYGAAHRVNYDLTVHDISRVQVSHSLLGDMTLKDGSILVVKNNLVDGIEIDANLEVERGTIYYLQNVYDVESGNMDFSGDNDMDPIINLTSSTQKRYISSGSSYDVTLYMDIANARLSSLLGTGASDYSTPVHFYTQPSLSTYETSLLAGISPSESRNVDYAANLNTSITNNIANSEDQLRGVVSSYGDLLLRNVVMRPVERWVRQFVGIDYIGVNTEIFDGLLFSDTSEDFNVNNFFSGTSVSFGKYISRDLFVKYEIAYEATNTVTTLNTIDEQAYGFVQNFGFEVNLMPDFKLANLLFEYNISPFGESRGQEFGLKYRRRFDLPDFFN